MALIALETYSQYFTNENAMAEFARVLELATQNDGIPLVTFHDRHIATALSPKATERMLTDKILQRFVTKPELLTEFIDRLRDLKDDDLVD